MRKKYFRLRILLLTFALGLASVWVYEIYKEVVHSLNNTAATKNPDDGKPKTFVLPIYLFNGELMKADISENERFAMLGHACGNGYVDGYISSEGERLSSGLNIVTPVEFKKIISQSEIIERVENFENYADNKGLRLVLKRRNTKTGGNYYEIIWYDKRQNEYYIAAENFELAREFETWQESQKIEKF